MGDAHVSLLDVLPDGQHVLKRAPFIVEVLFVPLPANEMEERRRRLRALLLAGAVRMAQEPQASHQMPSESATSEDLDVHVVPK